VTEKRSSIEVRYGWVVVIASLLISSIAQGAPNVLFVTLKSISAEFDWPRAVPSMAFASLMIGAGVGGVFMGLWMDRRGVFQPVVFGAVMISLGALLASQAHTQLSLYVAHGLLMGVMGEAAMIAPLLANVTRWFDRRRGLAVAIIASGQAVAGALWPPVARLLNESVGWRETYLFFAVVGLVTTVPLAFLLRRAPPDADQAATEQRGTSGRTALQWSPRVVQGALGVAVIGCCAAMAMPLLHLISHTTDLGYSSKHAAQLFSLLFVAAFFSRIGFGMLADRIGGVLTMFIASAGQAFALLCFVFVDSLVGLYLSALAFGLGFAGIMPCYSLLVRLWFPALESGWRIATVYLFAATGMAAGGWLGGYLFDLTASYQLAFVVGFSFNLLNLAVVGALLFRQTQLRLNPLPV